MKKSSETRRGFTIVEMLMALAILAVLLSAVALAMHASLHNYGENTKIAELTQTARVVLNRMMSEIRTADAVTSTGPQQLSIIPPTNPTGLTEIKYELADGVLYCSRTVGGKETSQKLIASGQSVKITGFTINRVTGTDGEGTICTKSVTAKLDLKSGDNTFSVTASACPRRNMNY